jgi:predicted NACHT family NTPase
MANPRSLKLSPDGKRQVERVLTDKKWSIEDLAAELGVVRQTAITFRAGRGGVDRKNFVRFCEALGLNWEQVCEQRDPDFDSQEMSWLNSQEILWIKKIVRFILKKLRQIVKDQDFEDQQKRLTIKQQLVVEEQEEKLRRQHEAYLREQRVLEQQQAKLRREELIRKQEKLRQIEVEKSARSYCAKKINSQYSKITLLSGQSISVDNLYVDVWLLDRLSHNLQTPKATFLDSYDSQNNRLGLGNRLEKSSGLEIASQVRQLLIVGKPGSGKTTFLKYLAALWCEGRFHSDLIAVFIEFRGIRSEQWNLLAEIQKELGIEDLNQVKTWLKNDKLLILMDGFDEVPTGKLRRNVHEQFVNIVKNYPGNRFIITCRTQIIEAVPDGFVAVEVADFTEKERNNFVEKWFRVNGFDDKKVENFCNSFNQAIEANSSLKELTITPVILGLICLLLQDSGGIPTQVDEIYKKGVDLLLRKWNVKKSIEGWEIGEKSFRALDIDKKKNLLIQIAAKKFENPTNFIIFDEKELCLQIVEILDLPNKEDARNILQSIEIQHGLLVERADELWSFSHLTFQEYFTTQWLLSLSSEALGHKITNPRWQEIVKQLIKAQPHSNNLLKLLKRAIDQMVAFDSDLQDFLSCVKRNFDNTHQGNDNLAKLENIEYLRVLDLMGERLIRLTCAVSDTANMFDSRRCLLAEDIESHKISSPDLDESLSYFSKCRDEFIDACKHACSMEPCLDNRSYYYLTWQLPQFNSMSFEEFREWWQSDKKIWFQHLGGAAISHFSEQQNQQLKYYCDANKFLLELLAIENAASLEVRREIEYNLLLPIDELNLRFSEQY